MTAKPSCSSGFTILEIIVTLTVSAILAVMLMQFTGTSVSRSMAPLTAYQAAAALQSTMESMSSDYKHLLLTDPSPLSTLKTRVDSNHYGAYSILASSFMAFDASQMEIPCDISATNCKLLKITIAAEGQSLTTIFSQ